MNKDISKAIMTRTRIRNRFLKEASPMNRPAFKKKNYCENKKNNIIVSGMLMASRIIKTSGR